MTHGHAVLGETMELFEDAAEWGRTYQERIKKNQAARKDIMESLAPLLAKKRQILAEGKAKTDFPK